MRGFDLYAKRFITPDKTYTHETHIHKDIPGIYPLLFTCCHTSGVLFSPKHSKTIAEYGLGYFVRTSLLGMVILFAVISLVGTVILLKKGYKPVRMGILSFVLGFFIEFVFMKPDWVLAIGSFRLTGGVLIAVILSAIYWFAVWGVPSYVIQHITKGASA